MLVYIFLYIFLYIWCILYIYHKFKSFFLILIGDSGSGTSREDYIGKIASDIINKLPPLFDLDKIKKKYGLNVTPTTVVLLQELERFNHLINRMSKSLKMLIRVSNSRIILPSFSKLQYWTKKKKVPLVVVKGHYFLKRNSSEIPKNWKFLRIFFFLIWYSNLWLILCK